MLQQSRQTHQWAAGPRLHPGRVHLLQLPEALLRLLLLLLLLALALAHAALQGELVRDLLQPGERAVRLRRPLTSERGVCQGCSAGLVSLPAQVQASTRLRLSAAGLLLGGLCL